MIINREKKDRVRLGWIGFGRRATAMLKHVLEMVDVDVVAIAEFDRRKLEMAEALCEDKGRMKPKLTENYLDIINDKTIDAVIVMTGWDNHVPCALEAVKAGKYTGIEVGCAYDIKECYELVAAYEKTGAPLMMLENCCYDRKELAALRAVREGLFGELIHADGAYGHYLNEVELFRDSVHYRQYEYLNRCCDNYPTHAFGPISKIFGLNRGNRALTISSFASKSRGLKDYTGRHLPDDSPIKGADFKQADIVTSVITCAGGETIKLTLDTTIPRPYYTRDFTIRGTRGCCVEEGNGSVTFYLEGMKEGVMNNKFDFYEEHDHPLQKEYQSGEVKSGHSNGMDWLVLRAFFEAVKAGTNTPIDAYDTATWLAIGPLSEQSIAQGGAAVSFPDFTRGKWFRREPIVEGKYCLDAVCVDESIKIDPRDNLK